MKKTEPIAGHLKQDNQRLEHLLSRVARGESGALEEIYQATRASVYGLALSVVQKIDFLWDDEKPLYQGEAFNKGVKYSFEIYAYGGGYQKWDVSTGDDTWTEKYFNVN